MLKIALIGANGKMGQSILQLVIQHPDKYQLVFAGVKNINQVHPGLNNVAHLVSADINDLPNNTDVVIDFSTAKNIATILPACIKQNTALLIGTTGFTPTQLALITDASSKIAILRAPNTSLAVNMLFHLSNLIARNLADFDAEIIETHHRDKKDAPSGTAIKLGEAIATGRNLEFLDHATFIRHGISATPRQKDEIGFAVVRGGDVIGKHDVLFLADGEQLTLSCAVTNRSVYAKGALHAADMLIGKAAGLYDMLDILQIK